MAHFVFLKSQNRCKGTTFYQYMQIFLLEDAQFMHIFV